MVLDVVLAFTGEVKCFELGGMSGSLRLHTPEIGESSFTSRISRYPSFTSTLIRGQLYHRTFHD